MDQVVVFQKMFEQVRKEQNFSWFYSELKHHRIAHYIYYLATDNIRIITHDDTVLLLRGTRNLLKVSTTKNPAKIKEAALLHICGKSTFREYCSTLADAGVFRWVTDVNHNTCALSIETGVWHARWFYKYVNRYKITYRKSSDHISNIKLIVLAW
ncbi:DUF1398 family protein [Escherichia coli]|uniref:DUF1398 family protein n=4 Tax=Escherichia coli TaxID=562 RepID=UPI0022656387|nr:DUF1398 family protein [Escherichia coli]